LFQFKGEGKYGKRAGLHSDREVAALACCCAPNRPVHLRLDNAAHWPLVTTTISLHFTFGIIVLAVAAVRLSWRATHKEPALLDGLPPWQLLSARVMHWLLYILLVVVPILGWINASWRGMPIVMFGVELPKLVATRASGWRWTGDVHALLSNYLMLTLVGLHVLLDSITISSAATA